MVRIMATYVRILCLILIFIVVLFYVYDMILLDSSVYLKPQPQNTGTQIFNKLEYCPHKYKNKHIFTKDELIKLQKQRINPPKKICNEEEVKGRAQKNWTRLNVQKLPNNMLSFVNRCKLKIFDENAEFTELWTNNEVSYNHIYKNGGTTIWNAMDKLQKDGLMNGHGIKYKLHKNDSFLLKDNKYYWDHRQYFYNYLADNFYFTFIRDPIDRFLSSFYEVAFRAAGMSYTELNELLKDNYNVNENGDQSLSGMDGMRLLYGRLLKNKCKGLNDVNDGDRKRQKVFHVWTGDPHLHPQIVHLMNKTFEWFPYDYIGNLVENFDESFKMILDEFSDAVHNDPRLYDKYVQRARNRESGSYGKALRESVLRREMLSDVDIQSICEIYWIDYICLPFEVPMQCNLTDLFVKHYGDDVVYNDCYHA